MNRTRIPRTRWQEELNVFNMAISRAQKSLCFNEDAIYLLCLLGYDNAPPTTSLPVPGAEKALGEIWLGDEVRWVNFEREAHNNSSILNSKIMHQ